METERIEHDKYYHIYNCGIDGCDLFKDTKDYEHFLRLYDKYIAPVAETFTWCLMGNHFHLLVRVKDEKEIMTLYELNHCQGLRPLTGYAAVDETPTVVIDPVGGDKWMA